MPTEAEWKIAFTFIIIAWSIIITLYAMLKYKLRDTGVTSIHAHGLPTVKRTAHYRIIPGLDVEQMKIINQNLEDENA